ncbi:TetR/AcrR family transcriptional regulator [Cellulomonas persica]|uniref:TetR/AcrR family transcriptional regulator n=1 Tax=Cellulomonas persica TaxID=76861 RepID=UPI0011BD5AD8|nr:TetR/AcrR family transcriptional regulator [Cellulomonas persica]
MSRTGRAAPLPPEERRSAILRAVRPVVLERGTRVTTKELAQAAAVAEGTLFRVFPDKAALVREVVLAAVDPADDVPAIEAIDRGQPLADRVRAVIEIGLARTSRTIRWMGILHELAHASDGTRDEDAHRRMTEFTQRQERGQRAVRAAITDVLGADGDRLARPADQVAELLAVTVLGLSMLQIEATRRGAEPQLPDLDVVVAHFLHGALGAHPPHPHPPHLHPSSSSAWRP